MIRPADNDGFASLLRDLQSLGFSDYEARAYVALLGMSAATAYEVSKQAQLPKANAYAVLDSLSKKHAVQPVSENPTRFMAVAPDVLLDRVEASTEQCCMRLRKGLAQVGPQHQQDYVWSITGMNEVGNKIRSMIQTAERHIWVKAGDDTLDPYRDELRAAAERGVQILIILFGRRIDDFRFGHDTRAYLHEGNGIHTGLSPHLITLTRDFDEALVVDLRDGARGTYTRNKPLVNVADTLIRHEVYFTEIFERFGDRIQDVFGPALIDLRREYLPGNQAQVLEERLRECGLMQAETEARIPEASRSRNR